MNPTTHTRLFADGSSLVRPSELRGAAWPAGGAEFRVLDVDADFDKTTLLLHHAAAGPIADALHCHGVTEIYVEAGQLEFDGFTASAEDYVRVPGNTTLRGVCAGAGTQLYLIVHGGVRMDTGSQRRDWHASDWLAAAGAGGAPAHIAQTLMPE